MKLTKLNRQGFSHEVLAVAFVAVFAVSGIAYVVGSHADSPLNTRLALITNSGSSIMAGWSLTVNTNGSGSLVYSGIPKAPLNGPSSPPRNKTFPVYTFNSTQLGHVLATTSLSPAYGCVRSISFGTVEDLTYRNKTTDGIDCYIIQNPHSSLSVQLNGIFKKAGV